MKMPNAGGSYTRNPDGSLTRNPHPKEPDTGSAEAVPKKPGASKGRKKPAPGGK